MLIFVLAWQQCWLIYVTGCDHASLFAAFAIYPHYHLAYSYLFILAGCMLILLLACCCIHQMRCIHQLELCV